MRRSSPRWHPFVVRLGCTIAALALSSSLGTRTARGARPAPYGGTLLVFVSDENLGIDPRNIQSVADLSLSSLLFEPLYRLDASGEIEPVLASATPALSGRIFSVPLRNDVLMHNGNPLSASDIVRWFDSLASPGSSASHLVLPIRGARARLLGVPENLGIRVGHGGRTLEFELSFPYPDFGELLASGHALVAGDPELPKAPASGTGPFKVVRQDAGAGRLLFVPFLEHREGRPYLDVLEARAITSRFGLNTFLQKQPTALIFGGPKLREPMPTALMRFGDQTAPRELVALVIGDRASSLHTPQAIRQIDATIRRERLVERHLGGSAEPITTLFGKFAEKQERNGLTGAPLHQTVELLVARESRLGHGLAERLQLDLLRAGISAKITRLPRAEVDHRRARRAYELLIHSVLFDAPDLDNHHQQTQKQQARKLHDLLRIAANLNCLYAITDADLATFGTASADTRANLLEVFERQLRMSCRILPIASVTSNVQARGLTELFQDAAGRIAFEHAYRLEEDVAR